MSSQLLDSEILKLQLHIECPICMEILENVHTVPDCQHRFCKVCIEHALQKCNTKCPSCRGHIKSARYLRRDNAFHEIVQSLGSSIEACVSNHQEASEKERVQAALDEFTNRKNLFKCQICSITLERAYVSTECNHRFCLGCISISDENKQCPCCITTDQATKIVEDNQYGELVSLFNVQVTLLI
jgi:hypothetical protein